MPLNEVQIEGRLGSDPQFFTSEQSGKHLARFDIKMVRWGRKARRDEDWLPILCAEHVARRIQEGKPDLKVGDLVTIYGKVSARNSTYYTADAKGETAERAITIKEISFICTTLHLTAPGKQHEAKYFDDEDLIAERPPI